MYEFTFSIDYETGTGPMMDVFIDHPSLVARGLHGCANDEDFWRIERLDGPTTALDAVERLHLEEDVPPESVTETDCLVTGLHEVVVHDPTGSLPVVIERDSPSCGLWR